MAEKGETELKNKIIEVQFSEKYEKYRRTLKFVPPIIFSIFIIIFLLLLRSSFTFSIILIILFILISIYAYWRLDKSNEELPKKVRIDDKGIFLWKRNKKEEFVHWNVVSTIRNYDPGARDIYIVTRLYKPFKLIPDEIYLPSEVAQIAIRKYDEYKKKKP